MKLSKVSITASGLDCLTIEPLLCSPQEKPIWLKVARDVLLHLSWIREILITESSLFVIYDFTLHRFHHAKHHVELELNKLQLSASEIGGGRIIDIPICYDDEFGLDLVDVLQGSNLSKTEFIELHSGSDYRVTAIGFAPGFGYLSGLPDALQFPRLQSPRISVPAGSVAIAEQYSAIYPKSSPGGWRIIGRTPARIFDIERTHPCLMQVSDIIRFRPIARDTYEQLIVRAEVQ